MGATFAETIAAIEIIRRTAAARFRRQTGTIVEYIVMISGNPLVLVRCARVPGT
jgi:hypothetical protein